MPRSIKRASAERPDPRKSLFRQLHLVDAGVYLVTYVFKPNETYNTATLSTSSFCVREKGEDWELIRVGLLEAYKDGELIAISFDGSDYEILTVENPIPDEVFYERQPYGIKLSYPSGFSLFEKTEIGNIASSKNLDGEVPF